MGSHHWDTFQRWFEGEVQANLKAGRPGRFADYLDVLQGRHHNFIRLWIADTAWSPITRSAIEPQPYVRTGPGKAADGGLKFDLGELLQWAFEREGELAPWIRGNIATLLRPLAIKRGRGRSL